MWSVGLTFPQDTGLKLIYFPNKSSGFAEVKAIMTLSLFHYLDCRKYFEKHGSLWLLKLPGLHNSILPLDKTDVIHFQRTDRFQFPF